MTIDQLMDELEGQPDFDGNAADYFCVSPSEMERLAGRAVSVDDVAYIMAREDWWRDRAVAVMQDQAADARSRHA